MKFNKVRQNLEKHGFQVTCFDIAADAAKYLNEVIDEKSVGFGGSVTLRDMGMYESLSEHNDVSWHWLPKDNKSPSEMLLLEQQSEIYLLSANGLAETGEIINIDRTGNRISSAVFGHDKVYFVIGSNKISPTYEEALWRARNIAAPKNAKRLNRKTPCAVRGDKCYDCNSPERICYGLSVLWHATCNMEVVLIDEELGY